MVFDQYDKQKSPDDIHFKNPEGWRIERLYDVAKIITSTVDKKSVEGQNPVKLCNYQDVYYNNKITSDINFMKSTASNNEIDKFTLKKGDVVFTKDSEDPFDIGIPSYVDDEIEDLVCGYHLTIIKSFKHEVLGNYAYYALKSEFSKHQFALASNGVTRFGLTYQGTKNIRICIPSISEQKKIVNFLDQKTTKIDQLIEKKKQLIEKLNEKRIAIITHAVTKGLDPSVPMKNSGVDWLGEVPEHWEIRRLRFSIESNPVKSQIKEMVEEDTLVSFVPMDAVNENGEIRLDSEKSIMEVYSGYTYFQDNDVVVAKITPCFENGKGAMAKGLLNGIAFGTTEFHVIRPLENLSALWLYYLSISHPFRQIGTSEMYGAGGQKRVPELFIKDFKVGMPNYEEQIKVVSYIENQLSDIYKLLQANYSIISKLLEYRTALITAAVTGKIDVRDIPIPGQEAMTCGD